MLKVQVLIEDIYERSHVLQGLRAFSHCGTEASAWQDVVDAAARSEFDAVIVEHTMTAQLAELRAAGSTVPVLMLTDMCKTDQRISGLDAGADDCLALPYRLGELAARLASITRRALRATSVKLCADELMMDLGTGEVMHGERPVRLSRLEFALLEQLMRYAGQTVTRPMLLEKVWNLSCEPRTDIVACHVARLSDSLHRAGRHQAISVGRDGYVLRLAN